MANNFNVHAMVANEALMHLENELCLGKLVHRDYDSEFKVTNGHEVGDTISIDVPPRFVAVDGPDITGKIQDVSYGKRTIQLNRQKSVAIKYDVADITTDTDIKRVGETVIKNAMSTLVQQIESDLAGLFVKIPNLVGTPGTPPASTLVLGQAGALMTNQAVPMASRNCVLDPDVKVTLAEQIKTLFMPNKSVSALERSMIGPIHNFDTYECAYLKTHTAGNWAGTPAINGANQVTSWDATKNTHYQDIAIDGFTSATSAVKAGDVINIAGCFAVNPATGESTGKLRDFVVVANATAATNAIAALRISPPIIPYTSTNLTDKAQATVDAGPADNAPITHKTGTAGTQYRQHLAFHKNALALVMKPLKKLDSFPVWETRNSNGFSITLSKGFDINTHTETQRLDVLYGVEAIHPALASRITS
jgi:hypothetical protein